MTIAFYVDQMVLDQLLLPNKLHAPLLAPFEQMQEAFEVGIFVLIVIKRIIHRIPLDKLQYN